MCYRGYLKYFDRDHSVTLTGEQAFDGWDVLRGGFRIDWDQSPGNAFMLKSDLYYGNFGHNIETISMEPPYMGSQNYRGNMSGGNVIFKWQKIFPDASEMTLQAYTDYMRKDEGTTIGMIWTYDVDVNYLFDLGRQHQIICGFGYRFLKDQFQNTYIMTMIPDRLNFHLFSAFLQDGYQIIKDRFRIRLGSKIEHNDYTGFEIQPNFRMLWTPSTNHTFWGAVSRAVRTPSRAERGKGYVLDQIIEIEDTLFTQSKIPLMIMYVGNPDFTSENLLASEAGYRFYSGKRIFLDISTFYNVYDHLFSGIFPPITFEEWPPPPHAQISLMTANQIAGYSYGFEIAMDWQTMDSWRQKIGYTFTDYHMHLTE
jgi:iron complex outermembrane receptor protein